MATNITVISGFLGSGKTTLIKNLLSLNTFGPSPVLIENDYGPMSIDSLILDKTGITIKDINFGCICCSLTGDFVSEIKKILSAGTIKQLIIEPSGISKLSQVFNALKSISTDKSIEPFEICNITVVDAMRFKYNSEYVSEYFWDQIKHCNILYINRTEKISQKQFDDMCSQIIKQNNVCKIFCDKSFLSLYYLRDCLEKCISDSSCEKASSKDSLQFKNHSHDNEFQYWNTLLPENLSETQIRVVCKNLEQAELYGTVLRAKGITGNHMFSYVPGTTEITSVNQSGQDGVLIIGKNLNRKNLAILFQHICNVTVNSTG